jgi:hypothetical protein
MSKTFTFSIPASQSIPALLERARVEGRARGIAFDGDATKGTFDGPAKGSYRVEGREVTLDVEKKPTFIPWAMIESALKGLFTL